MNYDVLQLKRYRHYFPTKSAPKKKLITLTQWLFHSIRATKMNMCIFPITLFLIFPTVLLYFPPPTAFHVSQPNFRVVPSPRLQSTAALWVMAGVNRRCHKPTLNGSRSWTRWKRRPRCWRTAAGSVSAPPVQPAPSSRLTCHTCGGKGPLTAGWCGGWLNY